jgi:pimeloyl-ACP methyl ester carboxylesterase
MNPKNLLQFLRQHRLAIEASVSATSDPQAAVVGVAIIDGFEIIFDTLESTRKVRGERQATFHGRPRALRHRAMARDVVQMMRNIGFDRFAVAGHDRGGRAGYRMTLDHPDRLERLALFDVIPTADAFGRADARFTLAFWPWSLLAQPRPHSRRP